MQRHQETVVDRRGNVVPGCLVRVTTLDGTLAQLYLDNSGAVTQANPVVTNDEGQAYFHAANGKYNIVTEKDGVEVDRMSEVVLFDPDDLIALDAVDVMMLSASDVELLNGVADIRRPPASATPATNGELVFELTDNTTLKIKVRGSDGVVRSSTLTLV